MDDRWVGASIAAVTRMVLAARRRPVYRFEHEMREAITDVDVREDVASPAAPVTLRVDWVVPAGSRAGDRASMELPHVFDAGQTHHATLTDLAGREVGHLRVAQGRLTVTLTETAESHVGVGGVVDVSLRFAPDAVAPATTYLLAFVIGTRTHHATLRTTGVRPERPRN